MEIWWATLIVSALKGFLLFYSNFKIHKMSGIMNFFILIRCSYFYYILSILCTYAHYMFLLNYLNTSWELDVRAHGYNPIQLSLLDLFKFIFWEISSRIQLPWNHRIRKRCSSLFINILSKAEFRMKLAVFWGNINIIWLCILPSILFLSVLFWVSEEWTNVLSRRGNARVCLCFIYV